MTTAPVAAGGVPPASTRPVPASPSAGALPAGPAVPGRTAFPVAFAAVYRGQLSRGKVARMPLMFVATLQSVGILMLLRGVVNISDVTVASQAVAGCTVLVVAFVALNLLAQRLARCGPPAPSTTT